MNPSGKVVAITGASSGLGRALALEFAQAGAHVALLGRDAATLESIAAELRGRGTRAETFPHDLLAPGVRAGELVHAVEEKLGPLAILVSNAGGATSGLFTDIPDEEFRSSIEANLIGSAVLIRAAARAMLPRGDGSIVIISSGVALRAIPGYSPYCAAKAGLSALADSLRVELGDAGIRVVTVYPGRMATALDARVRHFGAPWPAAPGQGADARHIASRVVAGVRRDAASVVVRGPAWIAWWLHRFSPRLVDRILARRFRVLRERSRQP